MKNYMGLDWKMIGKPLLKGRRGLRRTVLAEMQRVNVCILTIWNAQTGAGWRTVDLNNANCTTARRRVYAALPRSAARARRETVDAMLDKYYPA